MFVPVLIAINVAVYAVMVIRGVNWWMPSADETIPWGVDFWPLTTTGEWYRLMTSAFVHFGIFHIALNMWALHAVGKFTERLFGNLFFLLIYLFSAVLSGLTSIWWNHEAAAAGASGAIFAIYGALIAYLLFQRAAFPVGAVARLLRSTMGFVLLNVAFGFSVTGISNAAHLGGLASGFVLGAVMARPLNPDRRRRQTIPKLLAGVALGSAMAVAGVALIPKASAADRAEVDFTMSWHEIATQATRAASETGALLDRLNSEKITDQALAEQFERDVIPAWSGIADRLKGIPIAADSPQRQKYIIALGASQFFTNKYKKLASEMRSPDPAVRQSAKSELQAMRRSVATQPIKPDEG